MTENDGSVSFYFFDLDDNLFFLPTKLYLWNSQTQIEREISSGEFATAQHLTKDSSGIQEWVVREDYTYRNFRDVPGISHEEQQFSKDLLAAIKMPEWKGPSWALLEHAAKKQRPVVFISARGHAPEVIEAGFRGLADQGLLAAPLSILGIYTVSNPGVQKELGVTDRNMSIPAMKKIAIKAAVEKALETYGKEPPHRFGMSDDDPNNVMLAINAMRDCKEKYPDKRFFVVNTNKDHYVKLEIFPMLHPVTADAEGKRLLSQPDESESRASRVAQIEGGNVSINVTDLDKEIEFYTNGLGLKLKDRNLNEWAEVDSGKDFVIKLVSVKTSVLDKQNTPVTPGTTTINLTINGQLEELVSACKQRGIVFTSSIVEHAKARVIACADPDGNLLHLIETLQ